MWWLLGGTWYAPWKCSTDQKSDSTKWLWTFSILWPYIFQNSYAWYAWYAWYIVLHPCHGTWNLVRQMLVASPIPDISNRQQAHKHGNEPCHGPCLYSTLSFFFFFFLLFFQCDYHFKIFLIDFKPFKTGQSPHESTWSPFPPTARATVLDSIPRHRDNSTSEREHRSCRAAQPGVPYFRRLGNLGLWCSEMLGRS